jgi:hypothetical protein
MTSTTGDITATTGDLVATAGAVTADGNITTANGDIFATTGDITASAGDITATGGSVSAGTFLDAGTFVAAGTTVTAGTSMAAGTTVTAGTGVTATTGDITAATGDLVSTAGDITAQAGDITADVGDITATAGDVVATAGNVTSGLAPTLGVHCCNKTYTDTLVATGIGDWKNSVQLATAAALPANNYAGTPAFTLTAVANGQLTVDGVAVNASDAILVKDEVAQTNNGIYTVTQAGDGANPYILTRRSDYDASSEISAGNFVYVESGGTANGTTQWVMNNTSFVTLDTHNITWAKIHTLCSTLTTKGDIATYSTNPTRLAVGTNDYVLMADSAQATGLKWAALTTAKAQILTHNGSDPTALAVGADTQVLTADSAEATGLKWATPTTSTMTFEYSAVDFLFPNNADWAVNAGAPSIQDDDDNCLTVRAFDDAAEEGVGGTFRATNTTLDLRFCSRGQGGAGNVILNMYLRSIPDNGAVAAWDGGTTLTTIAIPANENFQYDTDSSVSVTNGRRYWFELTRDGADGSDTLVGDWYLLALQISFS